MFKDVLSVTGQRERHCVHSLAIQCISKLMASYRVLRDSALTTGQERLIRTRLIRSST